MRTKFNLFRFVEDERRWALVARFESEGDAVMTGRYMMKHLLKSHKVETDKGKLVKLFADLS